MKVSESIGQFLHARKTEYNADLIGDWNIGLETQVNAAQDNGEKVPDPRRTIWTDGADTWSSFRIPHHAKTDPVWRDYEARWILDEHSEGIGVTGWNWKTRCSVFVGFDVDSIVGHAEGVGISDEDLQKVKEAASTLPYVTIRRSTGGKGLHLYIPVANIPTSNHVEHARLADFILAKMSNDCGYPFAGKVDARGQVLWIWHRRASVEKHSFEIIQKATVMLTEADLPADWQIVPEKVAPKMVKTNSAVEDYKINGGWQVLRDLGYNLTDTTFLRPGSDKEKSGDFTTSKDGVPLAVVYSSGMKPLEVKKAYNQFTVLQYLKHGGSKGKALAEIEAQGFGAERIPFATLKEWVETRTSTNWLVDKMWVAGQPGLIAGEEKTLKTYTAMELAIALASGTPFLGRFKVNGRHRVGLLSGESGRDTLTETGARICKAKGISYDVPDLYLQEWVPHFNQATDLSRLTRAFREHKMEVLIADPLGHCVPGVNVANQFEVYAAMDPIIQLCREHGVSLILVCHTRKRGKGDQSYGTKSLSDIAYAGWAALARQWIILHRREEFHGDGFHKLWLDYGGSAGQGGRWGYDVNEGPDCEHRLAEISIRSCEDVSGEKKDNTYRQRILDALSNYPDGETKTNIFLTANPKIHSDAGSRNVFEAMLAEGVLVPCTVTKLGKVYDGYKLAPSPVEGATGVMDVTPFLDEWESANEEPDGYDAAQDNIDWTQFNSVRSPIIQA
jgi:hypothetical protein